MSVPHAGPPSQAAPTAAPAEAGLKERLAAVSAELDLARSDAAAERKAGLARQREAELGLAREMELGARVAELQAALTVMEGWRDGVPKQRRDGGASVRASLESRRRPKIPKMGSAGAELQRQSRESGTDLSNAGGSRGAPTAALLAGRQPRQRAQIDSDGAVAPPPLCPSRSSKAATRRTFHGETAV